MFTFLRKLCYPIKVFCLIEYDDFCASCVLNNLYFYIYTPMQKKGIRNIRKNKNPVYMPLLLEPSKANIMFYSIIFNAIALLDHFLLVKKHAN